jgi:membrane associated rhomboid family serine protease
MASTEQTQTTVCYRHPGRETLVSCSNCGRPICTDCMVQTAVGIKCPECAGVPTGVKKVATRARSVAGAGTGALVTKTLIGANVLVFLVQVAGGDLDFLHSQAYLKGALFGPYVATGDWWRLVTSGFLHAGFAHIFFNMLMLWWFGSALESYLGRGRFLAVYAVSLLAGSAGALVAAPDTPTIGASGAVFGVLGAGVVLERRGLHIFGGAALMIVLANLAFGYIVYRGQVSIGGHVGGLIGGALAVLALSGFSQANAAYRRIDLVGALGLAGIALASVLVAYWRVRGYA